MADVDVASVAALIGDRARAAMLDALMSTELTAGELARRAGVAAPTASAHLSKLLDGRLVIAERRGRHRYFRLADDAVAEAVEALAAIAPRRPTRSLRDAYATANLTAARTCYDHLAGRLGVALAEALEQRGALYPDGNGYVVSDKGVLLFGRLDIDVDELARKRRPLARRCIDWSERRPHLAGALGAALAARLFELGWVIRHGSTRAVQLTPAGAAALPKVLGGPRLDLPV